LYLSEIIRPVFYHKKERDPKFVSVLFSNGYVNTYLKIPINSVLSVAEIGLKRTKVRFWSKNRDFEGNG